MYVRNPPSQDALADLETLICGYEAALNLNGIQETYEGRQFSRKAFGDWLQETRKWSAASG